MTDLHVGDVQSPARFEFFNREFRDPRFAGLIPRSAPRRPSQPMRSTPSSGR